MDDARQATVGRQGAAETRYVPPIDDAELARRNQAAIRLLDSWEGDEDRLEQRETMTILREALGERRVASTRDLFP